MWCGPTALRLPGTPNNSCAANKTHLQSCPAVARTRNLPAPGLFTSRWAFTTSIRPRFQNSGVRTSSLVLFIHVQYVPMLSLPPSIMRDVVLEHSILVRGGLFPRRSMFRRPLHHRLRPFQFARTASQWLPTVSLAIICWRAALVTLLSCSGLLLWSCEA